MAAAPEPFRPSAPTNGKAFTVDVNALVIALITVLLTAILGFAAMGFFHLNTKIDGLGHDLRQEMNDRFDKQDARLDKRFDEQNAWLGKQFDKQDARLDKQFDKQDARLDKRFDKQDARLDKRLDKQDVRLDKQFDSLHQEIADLRTLVIERLPAPSQR